MSEKLKPKDKITQKMSRDGLIETNETQQTARRISRLFLKRTQEPPSAYWSIWRRRTTDRPPDGTQDS